MKKIRCLIIDDEPLALDLIESYVLKTSFLELAGKCASAFEAIEIIHQEPIDLLFLDIQMPDLSGLELTRSLPKGPKVIFTTAFEQYALEGFKADAIDYLLKPFNYAEFLKAASKAREWMGFNQPAPAPKEEIQEIFVKSDYKLVKISLPEVLYIEGMKDYAKIYLITQDRPVLTLMSLKALEEQLPDRQFMRVHRSYIVNLSRIEAVERSQINIKGNLIPVADQYKEGFQQYLSNKSM
jgi:DNA-binding LytR/AlgR family response regulator